MSNESRFGNTLARRFMGNFASILTSDLLNKGTTFLVYIMVARELGPYEFGQMSLALTLFYSFQVIATFGMQTVITREVAQDDEHVGKYFGSGLIVGLLMSLVAMALLLGAVFLLNYPVETRRVVLLISLGLVPFAVMTICESVIRGIEKMHLIALVNVPVNLMKIGAVWWLLKHGGSVEHVCFTLVFAHVLVAAGLLLVTYLQVRPWRMSFWDLPYGFSIVRRSVTFVGLDTVAAWWGSLNIVLLSKMTNEQDVGLYNASVQLMVPMAIFYQSVMVAAFPLMCRKVGSAKNGLGRVTNRLMELLMILAIPGTIGLIMIAERALEFIYEQEGFSEAGNVVRITAFILILKAVTFSLGHVLWAGRKESVTLRIVVVDLLVNLILGIVLIYFFGLIGAAVAALLSRVVDMIQHYRPVSAMIERVELGRVIWKPLLAGVVMAVFLYFCPEFHLLVTIGSAAVIYFASLLGIEWTLAGSVGNLKARYL